MSHSEHHGRTLAVVQDAVLTGRQLGIELTLSAFRKLAEVEQQSGDGRALRLLDRYERLVRAKLDGGQ